MSRLINIKHDKIIKYRTEILKVFVSYYETMYKSIENWVFSSIKTIYYNIISDEDLDLNLKSIAKDGDKKSEVVYIQLETRVKGIFEALINNTNTTKLDVNSMKLLSIIISNNSYVPLKFYTLFELCRFYSENSQIR